MKLNKYIKIIVCAVSIVSMLFSVSLSVNANVLDSNNDGYSDVAYDVGFNVNKSKYTTEVYTLENCFTNYYDNKIVGITYYDVYYSHTEHTYSDNQRMDFIGLSMRTEGNSIKITKKILFWKSTKTYDFGISSVSVEIPNVNGMKLNSQAYSTSADNAKRQVTLGSNVSFSILGCSVGTNNSITYDDCVCEVEDHSNRSDGLDLLYEFKHFKSSMSDSYKQHILHGTNYYIGAERLYNSDDVYNQKIYITSTFISTSGDYSSAKTMDITHTLCY